MTHLKYRQEVSETKDVILAPSKFTDPVNPFWGGEGRVCEPQLKNPYSKPITLSRFFLHILLANYLIHFSVYLSDAISLPY